MILTQAIGTINRLSLKLLEWTVIILMSGLVLDVTWQVLTRYLLGKPSAWTDELATILMIWVAALGASLGFARKAHLGIDYFVNLLPKKSFRLTQILTQFFIGVFAVSVLIYGGGELVRLTLRTEQLSPALGIKMGFVYAAIPISGIFILITTIESLSSLVSQGRSATDS